MAGRSAPAGVWPIVWRQHGVVTRAQLRALGYSDAAIDHRIARGRLIPLYPGVYAVGRADVGELGRLMAAVLACGPGAVVSHGSAAALWQLRSWVPAGIDVTIPRRRSARHPGIRVHRRRLFDTAERHRIPVTTPAQTIMDLAAGVSEHAFGRLVDEADKLALLHPAELRALAEGRGGRGPSRVRRLLDRETFVLTRSDLERLFLPIARRAGLPLPDTQAHVNGVDVDFYFADRNLVVEADGGAFHRTPAQQTRDRRRDHAHLAAGLIPLRFTHAQIKYDAAHVERTLKAVAARYSP